MSDKKRKRCFVTMDMKLEALKRIDKGESVNKVAIELNVGRSTVLGWKKTRTEIESWCVKRLCSESIEERKSMKRSEYEKVSEALYQWFRVQREKGTPISGPILQEKALKFYQDFKEEGEPEFTASSGWLDRWKQRYGIKQLSICGERLSANSNSECEFKLKFQALIEEEGLSGEQIYNCDETGLNFRMLPTKSLALKCEKAAAGYKKSKERVTVLACSNATGTHKLKLALIGKSKKPRAFKNVKMRCDEFDLPVWYRNQPNAWMSEHIFNEWFNKQFVPEVEKHLQSKNLPRKALLILDNATTHPSVDIIKDGEIKAMFLPPNVTSLCQPMDQGVLVTLKKLYRKKLLSCLIEGIDEGLDLVEKLKQIDMLDVIGWISESWDELNPLTLVRSWRKLLDHEGNEFKEEINDNELVTMMERIPGCEGSSECDVRDWMNEDGEAEPTLDEDIVSALKSREENEEDSDYDEEDSNQNSKLTHSEGLKFIEGTLQYLQEQGAAAMDILFLRRIRDEAARRRNKSEKQMKITNFFVR